MGPRRSAEEVRDAYAREEEHRARVVDARGSFRATNHVGATFTWSKLRYHVPVANGGRRAANADADADVKVILRDVAGAARPGEVLALMGPTGSGKTSLLNALSGRTPLGGVVRGDVRVNGEARDETFMREKVAYVMQEELLFPFMTVEETLTLHCRLRRASLTAEEVEAAVSEISGELGLQKVRKSAVGSPGGLPRGVSGGERKRVNIGVEMVGDPEALFLDEPTSGLDSFQAQRCMFALKQLAHAGRTVVCTIHQPRSSIYAMFAQLLLLSEGRLMYIGDAHEAVEYFTSLRFACPNLTNPADFFMDITSVDAKNPERERSSRARIEFFASEAAAKQLGENSVRSALEQHRARGAAADVKEYDPTHASWLSQLSLLIQRGVRNQRRDFIGVGVTTAIELMYALIVSALFRGVGHDQKGVQDRIGCLFFVVLNVAYTAALPAINVFAGEKSIIVRERASGAYKWGPYYLSKYITELPKLIPRLVFCTLVYWIVGLRKSQYNFWIFVAIIIAEAMSLTALGLLMASAMPIGAALALGPACITIFTLFGGIYLNIDSIPTGARWIRFIDPIYFAYSALVVNEFGGDPVSFTCETDSTTRCLESGRAVLELYAFEDEKVGIQVMAQYFLQIGIHLLAFNALRRTSQQYMPLSSVLPISAGKKDEGEDAARRPDPQEV